MSVVVEVNVLELVMAELVVDVIVDVAVAVCVVVIGSTSNLVVPLPEPPKPHTSLTTAPCSRSAFTIISKPSPSIEVSKWPRT